MKNHALLFLALAFTIVCGCSNAPVHQASGKASRKAGDITAAYDPPANNNSRVIVIDGFQMKANCVKADVESQGFDAAGGSLGAMTATGIFGTSTPLYCKAGIVQSPSSWAVVKARIRMNDGTWSNWTTVKH